MVLCDWGCAGGLVSEVRGARGGGGGEVRGRSVTDILTMAQELQCGVRLLNFNVFWLVSVLCTLKV